MIKFRWYYDKDSEEAFLNDMSKKGYYLTDVCLGFHKFKKISSTDYTYRIDLIQSGKKYDAIITNNIFRGCPDSCVILDELKEINGFNIPTIVLTVSMNQRNHFINDLGFSEYIEKPLSVDKAKKALCSVINNLKFTKYKK